MPEADDCGPRTLSFTLTRCSPSGCSANSFLPMSLRFAAGGDISTSLPGGPTACDASEELFRLTVTRSAPPAALTCATLAPVSREPNGLTPLKSFWARPSQKLRWLKTALMFEGVFRPVARRTLTPLDAEDRIGPGEGYLVDRAARNDRDEGRGQDALRPADVLVSKRTVELRLFGSRGEWVGKSAADNWKFGPFTRSSRPVGSVGFSTEVGARGEVTCRAGRLAVAPRLHVPEERLAEHDRGLPVLDEVGEIRRLRNRHRTQRSQAPSARAELTTGYPLNVAKTPAISIVAKAPIQRQPFRRTNLCLSVTMIIVAEPFALDSIVRPPLNRTRNDYAEGPRRQTRYL